MNKKSNTKSQQNIDLVIKALKTHRDSKTGSICKIAKPHTTVLSKHRFYKIQRVVRSTELLNAIAKINDKTDLYCICQTREFHDYTTPTPKPKRKATNRAPKVVKLAPKPMTPITMPKPTPKPIKAYDRMTKAQLIAIICKAEAAFAV
jgi:hypothetical protein